MMQQQPIQPAAAAYSQKSGLGHATFFCPKCRLQLIEDPNSKHYSDIQCDICDRYTTKVVSCRPCDYDICYKCAQKRT